MAPAMDRLGDPRDRGMCRAAPGFSPSRVDARGSAAPAAQRSRSDRPGPHRAGVSDGSISHSWAGTRLQPVTGAEAVLRRRLIPRSSTGVRHHGGPDGGATWGAPRDLLSAGANVENQSKCRNEVTVLRTIAPGPATAPRRRSLNRGVPRRSRPGSGPSRPRIGVTHPAETAADRPDRGPLRRDGRGRDPPHADAADRRGT
jgi:hypothetical protein